MSSTYRKTFGQGIGVFTVEIKDGKIGTTCPDQATWWDTDAIGRAAVILAGAAPAGISQNDLIALAAQQTRAAWMGAQQIEAMGK